MQQPTQKHRTLALETALGRDALLIERVIGHEALGRPFEYRVQAVSTSDTFSFDRLVGTGATIRLEVLHAGAGGVKTRYFNGIVSQLAHIGYDQHMMSRYELVLVPWLWFLTRRADCRIFQNKTVPEIVEKVFSEAGFKNYELQLSGSYPAREYCVQYRETDFNFVQRLMEHEGIYYYWKHEKNAHWMIICDAMSAHSPVPDHGPLVYRSKSSGVHEDYYIHSWKLRQRVTPGAYAINSFNFEAPAPTPTTKLLSKSNQKHAHEHGDAEVYDNPGDYYDNRDGERLARIRREEVQTETKTVSGEANARWLSVGSLFATDEMPRKDQNGEYLATAMSFQAEGGNFTSGTGSGEDLFTCSFSGIPKSCVFRAAREAVVPRVQGPQTAIVSGPSNEEIYTDEYGRVKVQFLWDREGKFDAGSSCWIRVAQIWAGKGWGAVHTPRIGQEVIVDFLEGDPDRPIITGRVYNGVHMPPYKLPDEKTKSTVKSNSSIGSKGFNEIRMEDKKGSEQLFIHAERNQDIRVKADRFETIGQNRHLVVEKDKLEHVKNNRDEIVDATHKEKIGSDRNLTVGGKQAISIGGSHSLTVKGDAIEVFKSNHSETTSGDIYLKGANVIIEANTNITLKVGGSWIAIAADGVKMSGPTATVEGTTMADVHAPTVKIN